MKELRKTIKEFLSLADDFIKEMKWTDMALLKIGLIALGMVMAICLPKRWKRPVFFTALFTFLVTCLPLMMKWGAYLGKTCCELKAAMEE